MNVLCTGKNLDRTDCTRHRAVGRDTCRWHHPEVLEARALRLEELARQLRVSA